MFTTVYLLLLISLTSACDVQEQKSLRSDGINYLIHSFDHEYYEEIGSINFTIQDFFVFLNFSEPSFPFILSSSMFDSIVFSSSNESSFCNDLKMYSIAVLPILSNMSEQRTLLFYGCNLRKKLDVKIFILKGPPLNPSFSDYNLYHKFPKLNQKYSANFCRCNDSWKYVNKCLKEFHSANSVHAFFIFAYLLTGIIVTSALFIFVFLIITRVNRVGIAPFAN